MVNPLRIRKVTGNDYVEGTVIYQMCRDIRARDNDALLFAQELAISNGENLIVNYVIYNYLWEGATARFYDWVIESLKEVEETLRAHSIPLVITFENKNIFKSNKKDKMPDHIGAVVIDQIPLHFAKQWKKNYVALHKNVPLYEVDAHNCVPVWELSIKQEFAARTIRSKVHAKLPLFLEEFSPLKHHVHNNSLLESIQKVDWDEIKRMIVCDESAQPVTTILKGEKAAKKVLDTFLKHKLEKYGISRNEINTDGQSNLSPYIAHGNIARRRIILELLKATKIDIQDAFDPDRNGSNGHLGSVAAFIEECVVRSELCENYCYYNEYYDSYKGFPDWAKLTLLAHKGDVRDFLYTYKELEHAKTHDELWNAAQMQMVHTGKMHGYMRMYWAKKILEWTESPEQAMRFAVKLNDIYELDGRDPNGYVGCAWSIGGVHDRPWFTRPVYGAIRYMAASGVKKRGSIEEYIDMHNGAQKLL